MRVYTLRFNLFLMLAALAPLLGGGCDTFGHKNEPVAAVAIYVSTAPGTAKMSPGGTETVSVLRSDPVQVTIDKQPILTEGNVVAAKIVDTPDAPGIELRFDPMGTVVLEQYSATNPGGHFVILGKWGKNLKETRWLMAPLITQRINNGVLSFTPDMTRDEATQFVQGLNNLAKQFQTDSTE
ncbi:MAG TPA: hypothetical protein VGY98_16890 [Verrucomicrobiae bacterium]|nr:hypothetical protein [Verrucomicrobiae bacterium]